MIKLAYKLIKIRLPVRYGVHHVNLNSESTEFQVIFEWKFHQIFVWKTMKQSEELSNVFYDFLRFSKRINSSDYNGSSNQKRFIEQQNSKQFENPSKISIRFFASKFGFLFWNFVFPFEIELMNHN